MVRSILNNIKSKQNYSMQGKTFLVNIIYTFIHIYKYGLASKAFPEAKICEYIHRVRNVFKVQFLAMENVFFPIHFH